MNGYITISLSTIYINLYYGLYEGWVLINF